MCKLSLTARETRCEYFLGPNRVLSEVVTAGVLQPTPLKKNLIPRFESRTKKEENVISLLIAEIT
jgi:hypothetical protein